MVVQSYAPSTAAYTEFMDFPVSLTAHTFPYFYAGMGRMGNDYWVRFPAGDENSLFPVDWSTLHIAEANSRDGSGSIDGLSSILAMGNQIVTYPTTTGLRVGANGAGQEGHIGDIAEILLYPSAMANQDRRGVFAYLKRKYNITSVPV